MYQNVFIGGGITKTKKSQLCFPLKIVQIYLNCFYQLLNLMLLKTWLSALWSYTSTNKNNFHPTNYREALPPGGSLKWCTWKTLNRLRCLKGRSKDTLKTWGVITDNNCACGEVQTMEHIVRSSGLTMDQLFEATPEAVQLAEKWQATLWFRLVALGWLRRWWWKTWLTCEMFSLLHNHSDSQWWSFSHYQTT